MWWTRYRNWLCSNAKKKLLIQWPQRPHLKGKISSEATIVCREMIWIRVPINWTKLLVWNKIWAICHEVGSTIGFELKFRHRFHPEKTHLWLLSKQHHLCTQSKYYIWIYYHVYFYLFYKTYKLLTSYCYSDLKKVSWSLEQFWRQNTISEFQTRHFN